MCAWNINNTTEMIKDDYTALLPKLIQLKIYNWFLLGHLFILIYSAKDGQVETNCKFLFKLILVTMQCNHLLSSQ